MPRVPAPRRAAGRFLAGRGGGGNRPPGAPPPVAHWQPSRSRVAFSFSRPAQVPVTAAIIAVNLVTFLGDFFTQRPLWTWLWLSPPVLPVRPWTLLTYPLSTPLGILSLLLTLYVFWWVGSSLEGRWRTPEFGLFMLAVTVVTGLAFCAGSLVVGAPVLLAGLHYPLSAVFIAWCMLNPEATVYFMMVLPLKARYLAYIDLILVYFGTGPVLGLFALVAPLGAWWYVARGRGLGWRGAGRPSHPRDVDLGRYARRRRWMALLNPLGWWERRRRRREFERLMRISGLGDRDRDDHDRYGPN